MQQRRSEKYSKYLKRFKMAKTLMELYSLLGINIMGYCTFKILNPQMYYADHAHKERLSGVFQTLCLIILKIQERNEAVVLKKDTWNPSD